MVAVAVGDVVGVGVGVVVVVVVVVGVRVVVVVGVVVGDVIGLTMSETDLAKSIRDALELAGVTVARTQAGRVKVRGAWMHLAPVGWPDITGYLTGGRMLGLEVKRPGEKPTPAQVAWRDRAIRAGVCAAIVHSPQEALHVANLGRHDLFFIQETKGKARP